MRFFTGLFSNLLCISYTTIQHYTVHPIHDGERSHICQSIVSSLVVDQQIKGFHLNVNQKGNKSIIVIWKRTALFAYYTISSTLIPSQGVFTTSHSGQGDNNV